MAKKYDAVIVLAGGVNSDGTLPQIIKERINLGIRLLQESASDFLVFSGHFTFVLDNPLNLSESESMKTYAISQGIAESKILLDDKSKDTLSNAYFVKVDLAIPRNWKKLAVVSSETHIERAKYLFNKVFGANFKIDYSSTPFTQLDTEGSAKSKEMERKQLVFSHQWLDPIKDGDDRSIKELLFTKHPGFAPNPEFTITQLIEQLNKL